MNVIGYFSLLSKTSIS